MKSETKKIIGFACALLIIAGIIVVVLKGFNVSLSLRQHDTFKFVFDQKFEENDIDAICKDVFGDKEYEIETVEVFTDAVYIISPSITEEEQNKLKEAFSKLYPIDEEDVENKEVSESEDIVDEEIVEDGIENEEKIETVEDSEENVGADIEVNNDELSKNDNYAFYTDARIRIRDIVNPYILPSIISLVIITVYIVIKYRKLNNGKIFVTVASVLLEMAILILALLSIIAICRIPFQSTIVPIIILIVLVWLVLKLFKFEKNLMKINEKTNVE